MRNRGLGPARHRRPIFSASERRAGHRNSLQGIVRQGQPHFDSFVPRRGYRAGRADARRHKGTVLAAHHHRHTRTVAGRKGRRGRGHHTDSRIPMPTDRPAGRSCPDRQNRKHKKGAVPLRNRHVLSGAEGSRSGRRRYGSPNAATCTDTTIWWWISATFRTCSA